MKHRNAASTLVRGNRRCRNRPLLSALLACTLVAGSLMSIADRADAAAAGPIRGPGTSGKCVDVAGDDTAITGAPVQIWNCLNVTDQQWTAGTDGTLRSMGKCMDVEGYGTANFSKIHLWDCHGGANQQWQIRADGSIRNPVSGRCLDDNAGNTANGVQLQLYDCNGQWPQSWQTNTGGGGQFGNTVLHPEKLGVYAIPDLAYADSGRTLASLRRLHALLPQAWLRWDNETGHWHDTPAAVEGFISQANQAGIPMIIAACCVDGYDNWWARGGSQPTVSIGQIADGPYLSFAARMQNTYPNVRYIETINEPDTGWFVADPDDIGAWNHYLDRLTAAVGGNTDRLLGPAAAFRSSQIWNNTIARPQIQHISYHTYGGWQSLSDIGGKTDTWVTEYGDSSVPDNIGRSPAFLLSDLWHAEAAGKLTGNIRQIFYVDLQHMIDAGSSEGDHYGFSGQLRALAAYQALANVSSHAYLDSAHDDVVATDNGKGQFAALVWNNTDGAAAGQDRTIPHTSVTPAAALNVLTVFNRGAEAAECGPLAAQSRVGVTISGGTVTIHFTSIDPRAAVLLTTAPCADPR